MVKRYIKIYEFALLQLNVGIEFYCFANPVIDFSDVFVFLKFGKIVAFGIIILTLIFVVYIRYKKMGTCVTPFPEVSSKDEVAGGELKKFPARLFAVPPRIAKGFIEGVTAESYEEDNKLWKKRLNAYKRINRLIGTTRYRNVMDMNAGLGGFAAALESPKSWVMNVVPTISKNTLGVIYERGLIGMYHDWYVPTIFSLFVAQVSYTFPIFLYTVIAEIC